VNTDLSFFVSDLHGHVDRYEKLFARIYEERPAGVFLGGDLFPSFFMHRTSHSGEVSDFANDFLIPKFMQLMNKLGKTYPDIFLILGNDDLRADEASMQRGEDEGLWQYVHGKKSSFSDHPVYGYACVPPTPFRLKDWERFDVSRFVDINCISPDEGMLSVPVPKSEILNTTIASDLDQVAGSDDLGRAVFLFHTPPYRTHLDKAALEGKMVDHAPLDPNVGSIAVRRFIEARQPLLTLHGHVHESARLTGFWRDKIGRTHTFSAAHDGPELALVRFRLENLEASTRELL